MESRSPHERGADAEALAADYLRARGLIVTARNLRCRAGEIDIVCLDGAVLVIVEVRRRGSRRYGGALASITWRKRRRVIRATLFHWQRQPEWRSRTVRFDVVALQDQDDAAPEITWVKDAFRIT